MGFPGGSVVKNPPANAGDSGSIPGWGRSLEKEMTPHSSILVGKSNGQRSLAGYSPWDCKRVRYNLVTTQQQSAAAAKSPQLCPTLCDPIDGSPPGSAIPGILQTRTLEWLPFPSPMHESEK